MKDKLYIVYLEPFGVGAFKTPLRSDTIWGALCWAIRLIHGNDRLEQLLAAYQHDPAEAFYLSSAFPYKEEEDGKKVHYFDHPFLPFSAEERLDTQKLMPWEIKEDARKGKKLKAQKKGYISQARFEAVINGSKITLKPETSPELVSRAFTHNTIDRVTGSTLTIDGSGQLYHTDEFFITQRRKTRKSQSDAPDYWENGLFFLLRANDEVLNLLRGALRFLAHFGIGGDRSIGKGRFTISEPELFAISEPEDANAWLNLSLYSPTLEEIKAYQGTREQYLFNYRLEDRWGRTQWQPKDVRHEHAFLFFKEGSTFPKIGSLGPFFGQNPNVGLHAAGFPIYRYGHAFMLGIKIPE